MKICFDARMTSASGIGVYIKNLLPLTIAYFKNHNFILLGKQQELKYLHERFNFSNVSIININSKIYSIKEQFELIKKIPPSTDLFWSPHYVFPFFYKGKILVTVHDVFHLSDYSKGFFKKKYAKIMFNALSARASRIVCVSSFTKNELNKYIKINKNKVIVIQNGFESSLIIDSEIKDRIHPKPYLLFVGNVKPHKNLSVLIESFSNLKSEIPHDLVIVGKRSGFITPDSFSLEHAKTLMGDRVVFTDYINDADLLNYYKYADVLVFPSLYEGFGFPPLEAMRARCPVVVSNAASMPEVCGDAAVYFDPKESVDLSKKILKVLQNKEFRESVILKGLEQIKKYSWERTAKQYFNVIKGLINLNEDSNNT